MEGNDGWRQCRLGCWHRNTKTMFAIITVWPRFFEARVWAILPNYGGYRLLSDETHWGELAEAQAATAAIMGNN